MAKMCILYEGKVCDDCNECNICDLDKNKICNNCGKCLQMEGIDIRAVKIDEIIEDPEELKNFNEENKEYPQEDDFIYDFIDDIKDLKDIIAEENEEYPGLYIKKK
ncbi:MAG: hypothetical protein LIR50_12760 [Bacillota bacterium]|nr:hypothetical protein [Bacillota bacterium]